MLHNLSRSVGRFVILISILRGGDVTRQVRPGRRHGASVSRNDGSATSTGLVEQRKLAPDVAGDRDPAKLVELAKEVDDRVH